MNASRLRAAIIGTGRIASSLERDPLRSKPHTHAGWYRACPETDLVAGCDIDPERLATFGADWHLPASALFDRYQDMLERVRPDIVSICGYAPDRLEMVRTAVTSGAQGLWVEKAVACSLEEIDAMSALVARHGVAVVVDQPRRGDPRYLAVKQAIDENTFGALQSVHCAMSGHFMHTGVHAWDVLRFWLGEWRRVAAWLADDDHSGVAAMTARGGAATGDALSASTGPEGGRIDDRGGHAHIVFENGTHVFVSGMAKQFFVFQFDLWFEGGRLRIGNDVNEVLVPEPSPRYSGFRELAPRAPLPLPEAPPALVFDLVRAVRTGSEPWMSLRHAAQAFRLGSALFQSHLEAHRYLEPADVRPTLYVASI